MSQNAIRTVIYTSNAAPGVDEAALRDILAASRRNNAAWHLSGVLAFADGTFLQVVEGPVWPMVKALARIETDPRHRHMQVLLDFEAERRSMPGWAMASRELDGPDTFALSRDQMDAYLGQDAPAAVRALVSTFFRVQRLAA